MIQALFLLYESASGYALFERQEADEIEDQSHAIQQSIVQFTTFSRMVSYRAFQPFADAEDALSNCNDVSEGVLNPTLRAFLENHFSRDLKKRATLGVIEEKLGSAIQEALGIKCEKNTLILELIRGIRLHFTKYIPELGSGGLEKAQLGLGHHYSRAKVKFNVNKVDNMIIQSISLLDQLDKDVNTFSMRCREWYSWHFPELSRIIPDQAQFARLAKLIRNKDTLTEEVLPDLTQITGDEEKSNEILEASKHSMGQDISDFDLANIEMFANRVIELAEYRDRLSQYLVNKMHVVAPNLTALIGEQVGARLISRAGSLTNLAKLPASTVQILGAEKALFRALKSKGNTPKYGLIYNSSFIGKAAPKNKGKISRYLSNKCTIASRLDTFQESATSKFGEELARQVEERLQFYEGGDLPRKNADVMHEVLQQVQQENQEQAAEKKKKKKKKKEKALEAAEQESGKKRKAEEEQQPQEEEETQKTSKKTKKKKKNKPQQQEEQ